MPPQKGAASRYRRREEESHVERGREMGEKREREKRETEVVRWIEEWHTHTHTERRKRN